MKHLLKNRCVSLVSAGILAALCAQLMRVALFVAGHPLPFDADEAHHASRGLQVYEAIRGGGSGLWSAIREQAFYPPLHSLLVAASYALGGGPGLTASRVCALVPLVAGLALLAAATWRSTRNDLTPGSPSAACAALFAVALGASSPLVLANSSLSMPESLGFLLSSWILLLATRIDAQDSLQPRAMLALGLLAAALGLAKYAYAFFTVPAIAAAIVLWRPRSTLSIRPATVFLATFGAVVLVWCSVSNPASLWHYLFGHEERNFVVMQKKLLFHPLAFISHATLAPGVACAVLVLAALGFARTSGLFSAKLALFAALAPHAVLGFSEEQGARHTVPSLVFVWYLAALGLSQLLALLEARARQIVAWLPAAGVTALFVASTPTVLSFVGSKLETNEDYMALSIDMAEQLHCSTPLLMLGRSDGFSAQWVRWFLAVRCGKPLSEVIVDRYPFLPALYEKSLRTGAPIARAYLDPAFPRAPLSAVLDTGYYRGLIAFSQLATRESSGSWGFPSCASAIPRCFRSTGRDGSSSCRCQRRRRSEAPGLTAGKANTPHATWAAARPTETRQPTSGASLRREPLS